MPKQLSGRNISFRGIYEFSLIQGQDLFANKSLWTDVPILYIMLFNIEKLFIIFWNQDVFDYLFNTKKNHNIFDLK